MGESLTVGIRGLAMPGVGFEPTWEMTPGGF